MNRILAAGLILGLSACATAPEAPPVAEAPPAPAAAPPAPAALGLIDRYDEQALRSILGELEYVVVDASVTASGKPFLTVEPGAGLVFVVTGEDCSGEGAAKVCPGVQLSAQFAEAGDTDFDELIARANRTLRPAKLFRGGSGVAYERYLILDGGVSRENLKTEISVYVEILGALMKQINP